MAGEKAQRLYEESKFTEAKQAAQAELATTSALQDQQELHAILAWCCYRDQKYDVALDHIMLAGDNKRALECHAYILAYVPAHKNDLLLTSIVECLPGNINAANALIVRARAKDANATHEQVWQLADSFAEQANVANYNVSLANLLNNTARFFLAKPRNRRDLKFAYGVMKVALAHYGQVTNWHHRASAHFWMSHILELLTDLPGALKAVSNSVVLWTVQCTQDKATEKHFKDFASAAKHLGELAEKLQSFSKQARTQ